MNYFKIIYFNRHEKLLVISKNEGEKIMKSNDEYEKLNAEAFQYILDNETVIYAVLKKLHIWRDNSDYDDLFSEARMLFLKAYLQNKQRKKNFNYYFSKIYWGLLDRLAYRKIRTDHNCSSNDNETEFESSNLDLQELVEQHELLEEIRQVCNRNEWILIQKILTGKNFTEIAAEMHVSRTLIYRLRNRLQIKLIRFFREK